MGTRRTRPIRLRHAGTARYFIVLDGTVYADLNGDGRITSADQYDGPHRAALLAAAEYFGNYFDAPFPGAKSLDPEITGGGVLNDREAQRFARDPGGVPAKRPDLLAHLDFFDRRDRDGMISISDNFHGWRDLGYGALKCLALTAGSALVFGRVSDGFAIDIERIGERRPKNATGIYAADGNVDPARLAEFVALFDANGSGGTLTHDQLKRAVVEKAALGTIPRRQFESFLGLAGRINGSRTVTRQQFLSLFDNSLFWIVASVPDRAGRRRL